MADEFDWKTGVFEGSVAGGYPSYEEVTDTLNLFLYKYPDLIRREPIGKSHEGRDIFVYKVFSESTPPLMKAPNILLLSLLHGAEPVTVLISLYTIGRLCEEFRLGVTSSVYLLKTRTLYIIPMANPDAYYAGSVTGKFEFRKNRRPTCPSDPANSGVDLNRNFPLYWTNMTIPDPCNIEYAGTEPFSEPETRAIRNVLNRVEFTSALLLHSFGEMLLFPFNGDASAEIAEVDKPFYDNIKTLFAIDKAGPVSRILKYNAYGEATDFLYGSMNILAFSLEAGSEANGFLPPINEARNTVIQNFDRVKAWIMLSGPRISGIRVTESHNDPGQLDVAIHNSGQFVMETSLKLMSASCVDDAIEISQVRPGWIESVPLPVCHSNDLLCTVEMDLICRCFPSAVGTHELMIDKLSTFSEHRDQCSSLGIPLEVHAPTVSDSAQVFGLGAFAFISIFLFAVVFLSRTVRAFINGL